MSAPIREIHRAEVVGSMLRPPQLVQARAQMRAGALDPTSYRQIEDAAVDAALRIQEDAGMDVVTDGEMRRDIFFDFLIKGVTGLVMQPAYSVRFHGHDESAAMEVQVPFSVAEKIAPLPCPAVEEFAYASQRTDKPLKVTLPGPLMILGMWGDVSRDAYPDPLDLAADGADVVLGWMREMAEAGCTYIQLDLPDLCELSVDQAVCDEWASRGIPPDALIELGIDFVRRAGELDLPGVTIAMHLCRGNGTQAWIAEGGYERFARDVFGHAGGFDIFHLEYDDARSGGFMPLAQLPDDKIAVLGLVSTKWQALEDPDTLRARIHAAARFHPLEHLAIAPQCGFASAAETAEGRKLTEQTQIDKLRLVAEVARSVWR